MTRKLLLGAVVLQLGLVALTWAPPATPPTESVPLVPWTTDQIDGITVKSQEQTLRLRREDGQWRLPDLGGYPADPARVRAVLDKLTTLEVRAPVATRPANHGTLNVSEDDHGRMVNLSRGDAEHTLVLGEARGSAVHVRARDADPVYLVRGWTAWAVGDAPNRYWDSHFLGLDPEALDSLTVTNPLGSFTLERGVEGWTVAGEETPLEQEQVQAILNRLSQTPLAEVIGTGPSPDPTESTQVAWTIATAGASKAGELRLGTTEGRRTTAQVQGSPWVVRVPSSSARTWETLTVEQLEPQATPSGPPTSP